MGLNRYEFHFNKFVNALKSVEKAYCKKPSLNPADLLYKANGRTPYFQLQGLARIDAGISKHNKVAEKWLIEFKQLEDAFGKYDYWVAAIEQNKKWKFNDKVESYLQEQALIQLGVLEARLIDSGWLKRNSTGFTFHETPMMIFQKEASKADWYSPKKERKLLSKFFKKEAIKIHDKLKSKEIDLDSVEDGIHEFRRKLRWLSIYSSALNGKVVIGKYNDDSPLKQYITPANQSSSFGQLPKNSNESNLVEFLPGGYYAMSDLIKKIGEIKDPALYTEEMMRIAKWHGIGPLEVKKKLGNTFLSHQEAICQAQSVIKKMVFQEKLLQHIAEYFEAQA